MTDVPQEVPQEQAPESPPEEVPTDTPFQAPEEVVPTFRDSVKAGALAIVDARNRVQEANKTLDDLKVKNAAMAAEIANAEKEVTEAVADDLAARQALYDLLGKTLS